MKKWKIILSSLLPSIYQITSISITNASPDILIVTCTVLPLRSATSSVHPLLEYTLLILKCSHPRVEE